MGDSSSRGGGFVAWGEVGESFSSRVSSIGAGRSDQRLWPTQFPKILGSAQRSPRSSSNGMVGARHIKPGLTSGECDLG